ncbi:MULTISPECIES: 3-hydroxyacyl-CoA dehydrogenase NAD-binding domain-containing protein [unclassified Methylobacterium]|uniref:3-hydroxyacyl-CoA dehydrogenase family protein n=1 Tax=unclassified Methylobacterium TaxID=2615210 RepID=UPI001FB9F7C1|nr:MULTISPECIES: 3-hydroxyacyl-CoA dehydrogenase NAD-binding domain-containing protein [unclassified Methylobacterium]MCJ2021670.1 3-hydroxyacyl-CoA dehydrogenase NAD-binding domain-containing protein [Methylobacterium sp. E-065]
MTEIAIVGGGLMGHGIALVLALHGHAVRITDTLPETRARIPALMGSALATLREAGAAPEGWDADRLSRAVRVEAALEPAVAGAGLVIEAITENPEAKRALFTELDRLCSADTILASNTSYLDVFPLIPKARQARALILHWYTPPYIVDLVDVVPGPGTDPAVVSAMADLVRGLGQVPIVLKRFIPGYIANRIQQAISAEVFELLDAGVASPKDIDDAIIHGLSLRIPILGHLAKADFTGLELTQRALANASYAPPPPRTRSETLDGLCAEGRTGVMAGRGYFDWGGRPPEDLFRERDRKLLALKAAMAGIGRMEGT